MSIVELSPDIRPLPQTPAESLNAFEGFEDYMDYRKQTAELTNKIGDGELIVVQEDVRLWIESSRIIEDQTSYYGNYDYDFVTAKIGALINYLEVNHGQVIDPLELQTTRKFVESIFSMYGSGFNYDNSERSSEGSYAFVVPVRMGRDHKEYGQESEIIIPAFRYVPNELRAQFMVGMPPFIIDRFEQTENGKRGYIIWGGLSQDMTDDLSLREGLNTGRKNVNNAIDFAHSRLGVKIAGLGATLPGLMNFGKSVTNKDMIVTTGHGGTVRLIEDTVIAAEARGYLDESATSIGVIGAGSIGASIAELASKRFPKSKIMLFDTNSQRANKVVNKLTEQGSNVEAALSTFTLIEESQVIIAAVTSRISLAELSVSNLRGKVLIDDSEPACFDPSEVRLLHGALTKVIGDDTQGKTAIRESYDYGTMLNAKSDLFGCEAEAASLSRYYDDLSERVGRQIAERVVRKLAIVGPVTTKGARLIGVLFNRYGIEPATFQAFKESTPLPQDL